MRIADVFDNKFPLVVWCRIAVENISERCRSYSRLRGQLSAVARVPLYRLSRGPATLLEGCVESHAKYATRQSSLTKAQLKIFLCFLSLSIGLLVSYLVDCLILVCSSWTNVPTDWWVVTVLYSLINFILLLDYQIKLLLLSFQITNQTSKILI